MFEQAIELIPDIVKNILAKEFNTSVKVCWNKRADAFRLTSENQKLQKDFFDKTRMQLYSIKSKKSEKKKVSEDI